MKKMSEAFGFIETMVISYYDSCSVSFAGTALMEIDGMFLFCTLNLYWNGFYCVQCFLPCLLLIYLVLKYNKFLFHLTNILGKSRVRSIYEEVSCRNQRAL